MADLTDVKNLIFNNDLLDVHLKNRIVFKAIDEAWLSTIEETLPSLDKAVRKPTKFIRETDRVLNIEQSKNITARSIRDLAVHSDYIKQVDENGDIIPSKILNVFRDETTDTYENRFVNTLIVKLYEFVKKRYDKLANMAVDQKTTIFNFGGEFNYNGINGKTNLSIEIENNNLDDSNSQEGLVGTRVRKVYFAILDYMNGEFAKTIGRNYVRPPIVRTNALLKNPDLRKCLALWEFIERYDDVGYNAIIDEKEQTCSDEVLSKMLDSIGEQCVLFNSLINGEDFDTVNQTTRTVKPKFIKDEKTNIDSEFDIKDSIYKSIVELVNELHDRKELSHDEKDIDLAMKLAIELAMQEEEKAYELLKAKQEKEDDLWYTKLMYNRSFLSRIIQAKEQYKNYYSQIKNCLLNYKKTRSRIAWSHEHFHYGMKRIATMVVRGKTLCIYLALDPKTLEQSKYHFVDVSDNEKYAETPLMMKVRSDRALKYVLELIAKMMAELNAICLNKEPQNYVLPYESDEKLINRGLIKVYNKRVKVDVPQQQEEPKTEEPSEEQSYNWFDTLAYSRSFMSRIIQADEQYKNYYSQIKNSLLNYKKARSRIAWSHEHFHYGMKRIATMVVRGKTLCVYLALDTKTLEQSKYHYVDVSDNEKYAETPLMMKVRSDRALKYVLELIAKMMAELNAICLNKEPENYVLPYESDKKLINRGLIKVYNKKVKVEKPQEVENTQEESKQEDTVQTDETQEIIEQVEEISEEQSYNWFDTLAYSRSFMSRIIQADEQYKNYYSQIKNSLLNYKKARSRIAWSHEHFHYGMKRIATMVVRGKTLCVYLALDPKTLEQSKYHFVDVSDNEKYAETPLMMRVRSDRALKYVLELIAKMMAELSAICLNKEPENYVLPYENDKKLINRGLIKVSERKVKLEQPKQQEIEQSNEEVPVVDEQKQEEIVNTEESKQEESIIKEEEQLDVNELPKVYVNNDDVKTQENSNIEVVNEFVVSNNKIDESINDEKVKRNDVKSEGRIDNVVLQTADNSPLPVEEVSEEPIQDHKFVIENDFVNEKVNEPNELDTETQEEVKEYNFEKYDYFLKRFNKDEVIAVIEKIKKETATSALEQVETEVIMCYKAISNMGFFARRKYCKLFKNGNPETVLKTKEKLLTMYMQNLEK